jgi:peptide/nickel transport system substrate-binding protein
LSNADLTPTPPERFTTGDGVLMQIDVIDAQTFTFRFADPYPLFVQRIARSDNAIYAPSHYLAHFHIDTTANQSALQQEAEQAGFDNWIGYYQDRNSWYLNPSKPSLAPWVAKNPLAAETFVMERNPFFFGVDSTGKQLPYVDQVVHEYVTFDRQIDQLVTTGNVDFQARHIVAGKLAFYEQQATTGDYRVVAGMSAGHLALQLNLTTADARLHTFFRDQRVRIALSAAVDRAAINQQIYAGQATPRQYSPLSHSPQVYPTLSDAHIAYNQAQANTLLDQADYNAKDAEGYRLWTDGSGTRIAFTIEGTAEPSSAEIRALQMVIAAFAEVGITATYQQVDRATYEDHVNANEIVAAWWGGDRSILPLLAPEIFLGTVFDRPWAVAWGAWRRDPTDGMAEEPPQGHWIRDIWALWDQIAVTADTAEQTLLFKEILDIWARELPMIGFLGEFPAPVIMKNGLRNYVAAYPIDDTTGDEHLLNPETLYWETEPPLVKLNYLTGQPGSYLTLTGRNFPANQSASVLVNDVAIATTTTDATGQADVTLDTTLLPAGDYQITLSVNPKASIPFTLASDQPLRAKEGDTAAVVIPPAVNNRSVYLPLIER